MENDRVGAVHACDELRLVHTAFGDSYLFFQWVDARSSAPLFDALSRGDLDTFQHFLQQGISPDALNEVRLFVPDY
jgi:hypothetical protein